MSNAFFFRKNQRWYSKSLWLFPLSKSLFSSPFPIGSFCFLFHKLNWYGFGLRRGLSRCHGDVHVLPHPIFRFSPSPRRFVSLPRYYCLVIGFPWGTARCVTLRNAQYNWRDFPLLLQNSNASLSSEWVFSFYLKTRNQSNSSIASGYLIMSALCIVSSCCNNTPFFFLIPLMNQKVFRETRVRFYFRFTESQIQIYNFFTAIFPLLILFNKQNPPTGLMNFSYFLIPAKSSYWFSSRFFTNLCHLE